MEVARVVERGAERTCWVTCDSVLQPPHCIAHVHQAATAKKHVAQLECAAHAHLTGVRPFPPDGSPISMIIVPPFGAFFSEHTLHIICIVVGCGLEIYGRQIHREPEAATAGGEDFSNP